MDVKRKVLLSRASASLLFFVVGNVVKGVVGKGEFVSRAEKPAASGLKRRGEIASD